MARLRRRFRLRYFRGFVATSNESLSFKFDSALRLVSLVGFSSKGVSLPMDAARLVRFAVGAIVVVRDSQNSKAVTRLCSRTSRQCLMNTVGRSKQSHGVASARSCWIDAMRIA